MKKSLLSIALIFTTILVFSKQDVPKYQGYRSLTSFNQDTVRYLQYNWGTYTGGVYERTTLSEFFKTFDLPICEVEICCALPGGIAEVGYVRFWLIPHEEAYKRRASRYSILINSILSEFDEPSMLYEDLQRYIPQLEKDGVTIVPWKESYKEALGPFLVGDIQYVYGAY